MMSDYHCAMCRMAARTVQALRVEGHPIDAQPGMDSTPRPYVASKALEVVPPPVIAPDGPVPYTGPERFS